MKCDFKKMWFDFYNIIQNNFALYNLTIVGGMIECYTTLHLFILPFYYLEGFSIFEIFDFLNWDHFVLSTDLIFNLSGKSRFFPSPFAQTFV